MVNYRKQTGSALVLFINYFKLCPTSMLDEELFKKRRVKLSKYKLASKLWLGMLVLMVALLLAACGDPTATPAPTATPVPPTATSAPPTATPAPTTARATTTPVAATTAAPAGGVAAGTPVAGSSTPVSGGSLNLSLPAISGATEIPVDAGLVATLAKQQGLSTAALKFYASDDSPDKLATSADTIITGTGYKFGLPGVEKPLNQGGVVVGFYQKAGSPDILMAVADPSTFTSGFAIPGISADVLKGFVEQLNGKKSVLILVAAPDLLTALLGATSGGGASGSAGATPSATPK